MAGFALSIRKNIADFNGGVERTMRGTGIKVFTSVILMTPVKDGRARASWIATGRKPSSKVTTNADKEGSATVNKMIDTLLTLQDYTFFTLTSNLKYINILEFGGYPDPVKKGTLVKKGDRKKKIAPVYEKFSKSGYSTSAPNGMVRISMNRAARILQLEAKRHLPR